MKFKLYISAFIIIVLLAISSQLSAQNDEYTIKAVFIEKLTRFIDWPAGSKVNENSKPFVISVIGENPFGTQLNEIYRTNKIKGKKVEIKYISEISEIKGSDILFISVSENEYLSDILAYTEDKPILTIGDYYKFADNGALISFYIEDKKIKFEINESALYKAGLHSSYLLLNMAKIVKPVKKM